MSLIRIDKNGNTFAAEPELLRMEERMLIHLYPLFWRLVDTETGEVVRSRTMAYFEGDYDPGTKVIDEV